MSGLCNALLNHTQYINNLKKPGFVQRRKFTVDGSSEEEKEEVKIVSLKLDFASERVVSERGGKIERRRGEDAVRIPRRCERQRAMPYSNVLNQAMQHGVSDPKRFGLCGPVPLCLLSLALCVGVLGEQRDCSPCPPNCSCPGLDSSCTVNCSRAGLQLAPGLMELPCNTTVL